MTDPGNTREELVRLTQLLVVEGSKVVGAFAARNGLHHTDVEALAHVLVAEERGAPMTAGGLGQALGLTSGAVTAVVDRRERAGHLQRERDTVDRRRVLLRYCPGGRALADDFFTPLVQRGHAAMAQFALEGLDVVRRWLTATTEDMASHRSSLGSAGRRPRPHDEG